MAIRQRNLDYLKSEIKAGAEPGEIVLRLTYDFKRYSFGEPVNVKIEGPLMMTGETIAVLTETPRGRTRKIRLVANDAACPGARICVAFEVGGRTFATTNHTISPAMV